jgi:pilus assembly protein CpaB
VEDGSVFNVRSIVVTLLALICGGIAVMGAQGMVGTNSVGGGKTPLVKVLILKKDLERGGVVDETVVEVVDWPESSSSRYMLKDVKAAKGRRAKADLFAGEPILDGKLAPKGEYLSPGDLIGEGMRAISIQFQTPAAAMAGLIFPKDRVDLYIAERAGGGSASPKSRLLLGNVEVFAIGDQLALRKDKDKEKTKDLQFTSVTFHVSIEDAAILDAARVEGQLSIGLRNPSEKQMAVAPAVFSQAASEPVPAIAPEAPVKAPIRKSAPKPAAPRPTLFLRGNGSELFTHSWANGR